MKTAFPSQPPVYVPLRQSDLVFPVHRVYCVGRNYAGHALEMGHDPIRDPPFFFQKNPTNLLFDSKFPYPPASSEVHHEVELIVGLHQGGTDIPIATALAGVFGYAVGIDMTRRDRQREAKQAGRPWEVAKAFEHSAPCSAMVPTSVIGHPTSGAIRLQVNDRLRQNGDLEQMIWNVPEVIHHLSALFTLQPGDLIFTGTPAGVAAVQRGDQIQASIDGVGQLHVAVV